MNVFERYHTAQLNDDQRLLYEERIAICIVDGHLSEVQAAQTAWQQVRDQAARVGTRANIAVQGRGLVAANTDATVANVVRRMF